MVNVVADAAPNDDMPPVDGCLDRRRVVRAAPSIPLDHCTMFSFSKLHSFSTSGSQPSRAPILREREAQLQSLPPSSSPPSRPSKLTLKRREPSSTVPPPAAQPPTLNASSNVASRPPTFAEALQVRTASHATPDFMDAASAIKRAKIEAQLAHSQPSSQSQSLPLSHSSLSTNQSDINDTKGIARAEVQPALPPPLPVPPSIAVTPAQLSTAAGFNAKSDLSINAMLANLNESDVDFAPIQKLHPPARMVQPPAIPRSVCAAVCVEEQLLRAPSKSIVPTRSQPALHLPPVPKVSDERPSLSYSLARAQTTEESKSSPASRSLIDDLRARHPTLAKLNQLQLTAVTHEYTERTSFPFPPLLLQAAPGSGKTLTLATRIAFFLSQYHSVPAHRVLGITFTKKACVELKHRVTVIASKLHSDSCNDSAGITVINFHQLSLLLLRQYQQKLGYVNCRLSIINDSAIKRLVKQWVAEMAERVDTGNEHLHGMGYSQSRVYEESVSDAPDGFNSHDMESIVEQIEANWGTDQRSYLPRVEHTVPNFDQSHYSGDPQQLESLTNKVLKVLRRMRRLTLALKHPPRSVPMLVTSLSDSAGVSDNDAEILTTVLKRYDRYLRKHCLLSFSDLCPALLALWRADRQVLSECQSKFRAIFVDEGQDTARQEISMLLALVGASNWELKPKSPAHAVAMMPLCAHLCVVGDPRQSIYGWRDADWRGFQILSRELAQYGVWTLELSQNYRSTATIVSAAIAMIGCDQHASQDGSSSTTVAVKTHSAVTSSIVSSPLFLQNDSDPTTARPFMFSAFDNGLKVIELECESQSSEIEIIVQRIRSLASLRRYQWHEIAVLARTQKIVALIKDALRKSGLTVSTAPRDRSATKWRNQRINATGTKLESELKKVLSKEKKSVEWKEAIHLGLCIAAVSAALSGQPVSAVDATNAAVKKLLLSQYGEKKSSINTLWSKLSEAVDDWQSERRRLDGHSDVPPMTTIIELLIIGYSLLPPFHRRYRDCARAQKWALRRLQSMKSEYQRLLESVSRRVAGLYQRCTEELHRYDPTSESSTPVETLVSIMTQEIQHPSSVNHSTTQASDDAGGETDVRVTKMSFRSPARPIVSSVRQCDQRSLQRLQQLTEGFHPSSPLAPCQCSGSSAAPSCARLTGAFQQLQTFLQCVQEDRVYHLYPAMRMNDSDGGDDADTDTLALHSAAGSGVTVSTIHAAKGLEWPCVFVAACNEGVLPLHNWQLSSANAVDSNVSAKLAHILQTVRQEFPDLSERERQLTAQQMFNEWQSNESAGRSKGDGDTLLDELEQTAETFVREECRLAFVACTRAKAQLFLSWHRRDELGKVRDRSRFLAALPEQLVAREVQSQQQTIPQSFSGPSAAPVRPTSRPPWPQPASTDATLVASSSLLSDPTFTGFQRASSATWTRSAAAKSATRIAHLPPPPQPLTDRSNLAPSFRSASDRSLLYQYCRMYNVLQ